MGITRIQSQSCPQNLRGHTQGDSQAFEAFDAIGGLHRRHSFDSGLSSRVRDATGSPLELDEPMWMEIESTQESTDPNSESNFPRISMGNPQTSSGVTSPQAEGSPPGSPETRQAGHASQTRGCSSDGKATSSPASHTDGKAQNEGDASMADHQHTCTLLTEKANDQSTPIGTQMVDAGTEESSSSPTPPAQGGPNLQHRCIGLRLGSLQPPHQSNNARSVSPPNVGETNRGEGDLGGSTGTPPMGEPPQGHSDHPENRQHHHGQLHLQSQGREEAPSQQAPTQSMDHPEETQSSCQSPMDSLRGQSHPGQVEQTQTQPQRLQTQQERFFTNLEEVLSGTPNPGSICQSQQQAVQKLCESLGRTGCSLQRHSEPQQLPSLGSQGLGKSSLAINLSLPQVEARNKHPGSSGTSSVEGSSLV